MAEKNFSQLTVKTSLAADDLVAMWDTSAGAAKTVTSAEIRELTKKPTAFFDINQVRSTVDGYTLCTVPTYVGGDDEVVHPCVVYLPSPVSGYHWWMVATPYSGADSATENPSVWASVDGKVWVDPGSNPIVAHPGGSSYNSDVFIWWDDTDHKFYLIWRQFVDPTEYIKLISSSDGITWSSETTLWSSAKTSYRCVSPSLNRRADGTWIMHSVDIVPSPHELVYQTSATLTGTYTNPVACTYEMPPGGETDVWHPEIRLLENGQYVGCMQIDDSSGGPIYMLGSEDGISFSFGSKLTIADGDYKSSFIDLGDGTGYLYKGNIGERMIHRIGLRFDKEAYSLGHAAGVTNAVALATAGRAGFLHADHFARGDNASTPGTADSGTAWTVESGTLGILSNQLYVPSDGNNKATLPHDSGQVEIFTKIAAGAGNMYVIFRYQDANNFFRLSTRNTYFRLQAIVSGSVAEEWLFSKAIQDGDEFIVRLSGNDIGLVLNGLAFYGITDTRFVDARKAGVQMTDTVAKVSEFYIKEL